MIVILPNEAWEIYNKINVHENYSVIYIGIIIVLGGSIFVDSWVTVIHIYTSKTCSDHRIRREI